MKKLLVFIVLAIETSAIPISATIIAIPYDYSLVQQGIDVASYGDTILVYPGTYAENINFNGHNVTVGSMFLITSDTSFISQTVIDGSSTGSVITLTSGENRAAVIAGLTIQNGYSSNGGGIYCDNSSPVIRNNKIKLNVVDSEGGGVYCGYSNAMIIENTISDNSATAGAGISNRNYSNTIISNNKINGNTAGGGYGGGICTWINSTGTISDNEIIENIGGGINCQSNSSPVITNNTIANNTGSYGGAIKCEFSCSPTISGNLIFENSASYYGGGIYCRDNSHPAIFQNTILRNTAESYNGGGIYIAWFNQPANPVITNNIICNNMAIAGCGGGIHSYGSYPIIENNTISGNIANIGGGFYCQVSPITITNNIFWANTAMIENEIQVEGATLTLSYCDIEGGWEGEGNIDCDPMFCNPGIDNFYLSSASCCVGAGGGGADIGALGVGCETVEIPTLSQWGMVILGCLFLAIASGTVIRRRSKIQARTV